MLKSCLTVAWRNLVRHRAYSLINISGLAIGMACCIPILLFVQNELSYDRFHANAERTYRVIREIHGESFDHRGSVLVKMGDGKIRSG